MAPIQRDLDYVGDLMLDPDSKFVWYMVLAGVFIVFAAGGALQLRGNRGESPS
jgi:hypothetical protein